MALQKKETKIKSWQDEKGREVTPSPSLFEIHVHFSLFVKRSRD